MKSTVRERTRETRLSSRSGSGSCSSNNTCGIKTRSITIRCSVRTPAKKSQHSYVDKYRKRWGIETAFRVLDNIQIKTTTKNPIIRHFINMFCCLVYNLWKIANILECQITLKNFVAYIVEQILQTFSVSNDNKTPRIVYIPDG